MPFVQQSALLHWCVSVSCGQNGKGQSLSLGWIIRLLIGGALKSRRTVVYLRRNSSIGSTRNSGPDDLILISKDCTAAPCTRRVAIVATITVLKKCLARRITDNLLHFFKKMGGVVLAEDNSLEGAWSSWLISTCQSRMIGTHRSR